MLDICITIHYVGSSTRGHMQCRVVILTMLHAHSLFCERKNTHLCIYIWLVKLSMYIPCSVFVWCPNCHISAKYTETKWWYIDYMLVTWYCPQPNLPNHENYVISVGLARDRTTDVLARLHQYKINYIWFCVVLYKSCTCNFDSYRSLIGVY